MNNDPRFTSNDRVNHPGLGPGTVIEVRDNQVVAVKYDKTGNVHYTRDYVLEPLDDQPSASPAEAAVETATEAANPESNPAHTIESLIDDLIEQCRACYVRGAVWRVAMGEKLFLLRAAIKEAGTRDFTETVQEKLGMKRQTAYDYIAEYEEATGNTEPAAPGTDVPNSRADAIANAIVDEKAKREGMDEMPEGMDTDEAPAPTDEASPPPPPHPPFKPMLDEHVKISLPKIHVRAEEMEAYKAALKKNRDYVLVQFRQTFYAVLAHFAESPEVVDAVTESEVDTATLNDESTDVVTEPESDDYAATDNDIPSFFTTDPEGYGHEGLGA